MYARSTTIRGNPAAVEDVISYMRDKVLPVMQEMKGCAGVSMLVERESGRCIATTAWEDQDSMRAAAERVQPMRDRMAQMLGAQPEVQEWEIAVLHREHQAGDGACARLTWTQGDPADMDRLLDGFRTSLMPKLQEMPGFCSLSLLIDRESGRSVGTVSLVDRNALEATRESARRIREEFTPAMHRNVVDIAEMDLVLAHLRVPETV
jgi:quinol monooxygenase YgiN